MEIPKLNELAINFEKSRFVEEEVIYLGNSISKDEIRPDISRVEVFENFTPRDRKVSEAPINTSIVQTIRIEPQHAITILVRDDQEFEAVQLERNRPKENGGYSEANKRKNITKLPGLNSRFKLETDASDKGMGSI